MNPDDFEQRLRRQPLRQLPSAWREEILVAADVNRRNAAVRKLTFAATVFRALAILWRELVLPARMTWAGIAAVWVVIGVMNLTQADQTTAVAKGPPVSAQELRGAWERRQELMLELAFLPTTELAMPPRPNLQPRSDRRSVSACA